MSEVKDVSAILRLIKDARSTRGAQQTLLIALAANCKPSNGRFTWPSHNTLTKTYRMNFVTAQNATKVLIKRGLINLSSTPNGSQVYSINLAMLMTQADQANKKKQARNAARHAFLESPYEIAGLVSRDCYLNAEFTGGYAIN